MRVLIIGCGYVGVPLGVELVRAGHEVFGLKRTDDADLNAAGIKPLIADIAESPSLKSLPNEFDWVVNTVAAGGGGIEDYRRTYLHGMRNVILWLGEHPPRRFVYTSSTSVYGQDDGSEVTEESPAEGTADTSRVLLETEQVLREADNAGTFRAVVLRCAGIYGPGRGYWLQQFLRGEAVMDGAGERWLNMVHHEDVVGAVLAALQAREPGRAYNVVDDEPVQQRTVFQWLATRLGRPMPAATAEKPAARRGASNKRVLNRKLKLELGWKLKYPSFRQGYEAEIARLRAG